MDSTLPNRLKLALVVPALNEEQAIAATLRRCLAARSKVVSQTPVTEMVVVFVNDGSTDGTQQVVDQDEFDEVVKVRFEKNRGYGAAIKAGWDATDADLVGFIDGDGTCDPDFCVPLVKRLLETSADVVLAGRMTPESRMPLVRRIGNRLFAGLLGLVSGRELTDSASGFRIVRRSSLNLLAPLPDGLHFTPAMSAICLLDPRLTIEEVPMPYEERIGRSKLHVIRDGLRFLWTIMFAACCYSPLKTLLALSLLGAGVLTGLTAVAARLFDAPNLAPWMFLAGGLLVIMGIAGGVVVHQLNFLLIGPRRKTGALERLLQTMIDYRRLIMGGGAVFAAGMLALTILLITGAAVSPYVVALVLLLTIGSATAALGGVIVRVIWAVGEKQKAMLNGGAPLRLQEQAA